MTRPKITDWFNSDRSFANQRRIAIMGATFFAFLALIASPAFAQSSGINVCGTQFQSTLQTLISLGIAGGMIGSAVMAVYAHAKYAAGRDGQADSSRNQAIAGIIVTPLLAYFLKALIVNILGYSNLGCIFPF